MSARALDHDEAHDLLGAYALDAVDDAEREAIAAHVEQCPECWDELAREYEALALLTPAIPTERDIAGWEALRGRLARTVEPSSPAAVIPFPRRVARLGAAAAAIAACSVLATLAITGPSGGEEPRVTAPIVPAAPSAQLAGSVKVFSPDVPTGHVRITLENVPDAPPGHHYEVWVLRPGADTEMEAIGAFTPHDGRAELTLSLPGPGDYVALDISVQENGGPPEHSGTSLAGATLSS